MDIKNLTTHDDATNFMAYWMSTKGQTEMGTTNHTIFDNFLKSTVFLNHQEKIENSFIYYVENFPRIRISLLPLLIKNKIITPETRGKLLLHAITHEDQNIFCPDLIHFGAKLDTSWMGMRTLNEAIKYTPQWVPLILETYQKSNPKGFKKYVNELDDNDYSPLMSAVFKNTDLLEVLLKNGSKIEKKGKNGLTALGLACHYNAEAVKILLKNGANYKAENNDGIDILTLATKFCPLAVRELLNYPVDINKKDESGMSPLMLAVFHNPGSYQEIIKSPHVDFLMKDNGGYNVLMHTVVEKMNNSDNINKKDIILSILDKGVPINAQNNRGETALMLSIENLDVLQLLCQNGANINIQDKLGETILMKGINAPVENVIFLLKQNPDFSLKDNRGKTLYDYVVQHKSLSSKIIKNHIENFFITEDFTKKTNLSSIKPKNRIV